MLNELRVKEKVIGVKQSRRAVRDGLALRVFLAADADPALTEPLAEQCRGLGFRWRPAAPCGSWARPPASRWAPLL